MKEAAEQALPSLSDLEKELAKIEADEERYRKLEEELAKKEKVSHSSLPTPVFVLDFQPNELRKH